MAFSIMNSSDSIVNKSISHFPAGSVKTFSVSKITLLPLVLVTYTRAYPQLVGHIFKDTFRQAFSIELHVVVRKVERIGARG